MKRHGILNSHISKVLTDLGHTDMIVIADCGLPIPAGVERIDLALELGTPSFVDVVRDRRRRYGGGTGDAGIGNQRGQSGCARGCDEARRTARLCVARSIQGIDEAGESHHPDG